MNQKQLSCGDCALGACDGHGDGAYPAFCPTRTMGEERIQAAMEQYQGETRQVMRVAAQVEYEGYGRWPRVQEIIEFAKRMGYEKLGIATCVGLLRESRTLTKLLRSHGFEVFGISCKAGAVPKEAVGIDPCCKEIGPNMCNPVLQAQTLNEADTQLNIVMGLCVGHDSLFYRHSNALTTTLVCKDRVLGHNPAAALYTIDSYYETLKGDQ